MELLSELYEQIECSQTEEECDKLERIIIESDLTEDDKQFLFDSLNNAREYISYKNQRF